MSDPTTPPSDLLTLQEAADELGVHYMTAYRYVRLGMLPATKQGRSWVVRSDDLAAFQSGAAEGTERGEAPWDERLYNRMLAADDSGAWKVVEASMASGTSAEAVYTKMLIPALRRVGEEWRDGDLDIAQEHAASRVAERLIARMGPLVNPRGLRRGTVVIGSTASELHDMPLAIAADLFRAAHFNVVNLGANLPPESFAKIVAGTDDVVAVAVGVTMVDQDDQVAATIEALKSASDAPILVGGSGIDTERAMQLGASASSPTAEEAIAMLNGLLESAS